MTDFMDRLRIYRTGVRRPDDFIDQSFDMTCNRTGSSQSCLSGNRVREEWLLAGTESVAFWATSADFEAALEAARRILIGNMYGDVLSGLSALRMAIYRGDRDSALAVVDQIQSRIMDTRARPERSFL